MQVGLLCNTGVSVLRITGVLGREKSVIVVDIRQRQEADRTQRPAVSASSRLAS